MAKKLYALLVGIDEYRPPVGKLNGCVNDIEEIDKLLRELAGDGRFEPSFVTLKNAQATRAAIIEGFRGHLAKAGPGDVALFYYCGHGSQEAAPPELWSLEPDRLNETLVCYDSRQEGNWDLADKELALLTSDVAKSGVHLVCILDCCHSGSGTRAGSEDGIAVRRAPTDLRARPLSSFLDGEFAKRAAAGAQSTSGWVMLPAGRHVLLAACRSDETAKEVREAGRPHGAFTASLLVALRQYRGEITYRDLIKRAEAQVKFRVSRQVPQIEANDQEDAWRVFLGDTGGGRQPYFTLRFDKNLQWVVDAGAINGIAPPRAKDTTSFAVFDLDSKYGLAHASDALATIRVKEVRPELSVVEIASKKAELDPKQTYRAILTSAPPSPLPVHLTGETEAVVRLGRLFQADGAGHRVVVAVEETVPVDFVVSCENRRYRIMRTDSDIPVAADATGEPDEAAKTTVERLERIARWQAVKNLRNPTTRLGPQPIQIAVFFLKKNDTGETWVEADARNGILAEYVYWDGGWQQPRMRVELRNSGSEKLYCSLLWLQDDFSVLSDLMPVAERIPSNGRLAVYGGREFGAKIPDELWRAGRTRIGDTLKVVASTEQFDPTLFAQHALKRFVEGERDRGLDASLKEARDSLGRRGKVRALDLTPSDGGPDWITSELSLKILRPLETARIPQPGAQVDLGVGVSVLGHPTLRADASLAAPGDVGRALGSLSVPAIFRDDPDSSEQFIFEAARDSDSGLGALMLQNVQNPEAVSPDMPLVMRLSATLGPDEHVLAYAWDGQFHLPLGVARRREGGTEIPLTVLPKPLELAGDVERGIISSIRIMFQKIASKYLPIGYDYPRLSAISYDSNGDANYESSPEKVRERVAAASNILLFVHGILGDTFGMTASAARETKAADGSAHRLVEMFDLVMAFDYENIETDIETTARALKSRLASVGLGPDHGKKFTIAAHSMGGLVSRWFIEREGGNLIVGRLVTLGTPHAGSPWSTIEDWAMTALAIGFNGLSQVAWPVRLLGGIAGCIERVDVTLDQMSPKSVFLANLRESGDPAIPYTVLIGNTSIIPAAVDGGMLGELLQRLSPQRLVHATTSLAFLRAPNDIAVAVESAGAVPKNRTPAPAMVEVACDHVTFFVSEAGRCALTDALRRN